MLVLGSDSRNQGDSRRKKVIESEHHLQKKQHLQRQMIMCHERFSQKFFSLFMNGRQSPQ